MFAKHFPGVFTNYGHYIVYPIRNYTKFVYWSWRSEWIAAEHLGFVSILNPFEESYLLLRANNLFKESQNDSWQTSLAKSHSLMTTRQATLHIIKMNFKVLFFANINSTENLGIWEFDSFYGGSAPLFIYFFSNSLIIRMLCRVALGTQIVEPEN